MATVDSDVARTHHKGPVAHAAWGRTLPKATVDSDMARTHHVGPVDHAV